MTVSNSTEKGGGYSVDLRKGTQCCIGWPGSCGKWTSRPKEMAGFHEPVETTGSHPDDRYEKVRRDCDRIFPYGYTGRPISAHLPIKAA